MSAEKAVKKCFVIAPIGDEGSDIRRRSDDILKHIIVPAARECGYEEKNVVRADKIGVPGMITSQVIAHLIEDDMVIADLTGPNANVFYELAIRHAQKKPCVHMIEAGQAIPFDVQGSRTIAVKYRDWNTPSLAKDELVRHIHAAEKNPNEVDNPISTAVNLMALRSSGDPSAQVISMISELQATVAKLAQNLSGRSPSGIQTLTITGNEQQMTPDFLKSVGLKFFDTSSVPTITFGTVHAEPAGPQGPSASKGK